MRRKNVSTEFLKECIADAFLRLLKTRPAEKITIQEIADLADVGRVTYFRNFSSKPEVAIFKLTLLWKRWTEERKLGEEYTLDTAAEFFSFCYANRELLELLYASGLELTVYEAFYRVMMPQYERSAGACYRVRFLSYGLFGMLGEWVRRDYAESPRELAQIVTQRAMDV